jgi:iron complex transport system substrate-binding protein
MTLRVGYLWVAIALGSAIMLVSCQPKTNVTQTRSDCVAQYDANTDYFPNKITLQEAKGFTVEYHKHYKVITVSRPWRDAKVQFKYALVQCGTPTPEGFQADQVVQIPVRSVVALSTTHLVQLEKLGVIDRLVAVNDFKNITTPAVLEKIKTNQIADVGNNSAPNIEKILSLSPDLITSYGTGNPQVDSYGKLLEAGLKVGIVSEYMESTPLGRAEWIKFLAVFFNREAIAEQEFSQVASRYQSIVAQVKSTKTRPTVFAGFSSKGTWYVPGGDSYVAKLLADAGSAYVWADDRTSGSLNLNFEQVYDRARQAEYWINGSQKWKTQADVKADDARYEGFLAVKTGKLYSPTARVGPEGGNEYWASGTANPDVVLADLVKVFHPELMTNQMFYYYQQLP